MVDAHQASETAANDRFLPTIGDGAHTALNAAALQRLSLKQHSKHAGVRVYRGNLVNNSDGAILDGVRSVDVSYIADTRGHGSSTAAEPQQHARNASGDAQPPGLGTLSSSESHWHPP